MEEGDIRSFKIILIFLVGLISVFLISSVLFFNGFNFTNNHNLKSSLDFKHALKNANIMLGPDTIDIDVTNVSSSKISLTWDAITGATSYNIYISPEPGLLGDYEWMKLIGTTSLTNFIIEDVSAATDIFIRVEAKNGNNIVTSEDSYARTLGGPTDNLQSGQYSNLDTPLREVHLLSPNIIMLVLANDHVKSSGGVDPGNPSTFVYNFTGYEWHYGNWVVTRNNGSQIEIKDIYRNSVPVGHYSDAIFKADYTDTDHRIYLILGKNVGSKEILNVVHTGGTPAGFYPKTEIAGGSEQIIYGGNSFLTDLNVNVVYSDQYLETPVIQVNQLGYSPRATQRYAYVSWWLGANLSGFISNYSFPNYPVSAAVLVEQNNPLLSRQTVAGNDRLEITMRSLYDNNAGVEVRQINLSNFSESDTNYYRVYIPGVGVSFKTMVSNLGILKAFYVTERGLYHNMWGRDLQPQWTEWSTRAPDHYLIYTSEKDNSDGASIPFSSKTPKIGLRNMTGGHHDAADYDLRPGHWLVPFLLMDAYETNPSAFVDSQLTIPESGNKIPDLLDEAL